MPSLCLRERWHRRTCGASPACNFVTDRCGSEPQRETSFTCSARALERRRFTRRIRLLLRTHSRLGFATVLTREHTAAARPLCTVQLDAGVAIIFRLDCLEITFAA